MADPPKLHRVSTQTFDAVAIQHPAKKHPPRGGATVITVAVVTC
jgi:hypothetical protein